MGCSSSLFSLRSLVRFTHTDPAGYVFFPRYFEMLQAVVEEWFTEALDLKYADLIIGLRLGTPTASIQCVFKKPSRLGDALEIAVLLEHVGNSSFRLRFRGGVDGIARFGEVNGKAGEGHQLRGEGFGGSYADLGASQRRQHCV